MSLREDMKLRPPRSSERYNPLARSFVLIAAVIAFALNLLGQGAPGNAMSTPKDTPVDATQLAVPGGAGATAAASGSASAGAVLGFQVWQQDKFFLASFFTFAVPQTFTGQPPAAGQTISPQHGTFGSLLLNPPGQGTSYSFTGNYMLGWYPTGGLKCTTACTVDKAIFFVGGEVRAGITNAAWTEATSTPISLNSSIGYIVPEFLLTSKTYNYTGAKDSGQNQYQFGAAMGPSLRFIGGDIAQSENTAVRTTLLGTNKTSMAGLELTFFVRMNQFKPYVRFTHFAPPYGMNVPGFSGSQFVFGVDVLSPLFQATLSKN